MQTLYTLGYLSNRSEKKLSDLTALSIPLVDIRYNPSSKHAMWLQEVLKAKLGGNYYWLQALGNVNYKKALNGSFTEADIAIKNIDAGLSQLAEILKRHGKACLLCACADKTRCHRSVVAREAEARLGCKIVHI
jgi:uncharacterized protein (DUF488 family)